ncbi:hypothetical protein [Tumebacillus flagellatus]|nr:hypothetical protein [Tumebacillus flagellatus]
MSEKNKLAIPEDFHPSFDDLREEHQTLYNIALSAANQNGVDAQTA